MVDSRAVGEGFLRRRYPLRRGFARALLGPAVAAGAAVLAETGVGHTGSAALLGRRQTDAAAGRLVAARTVVVEVVRQAVVARVVVVAAAVRLAATALEVAAAARIAVVEGVVGGLLGELARRLVAPGSVAP